MNASPRRRRQRRVTSQARAAPVNRRRPACPTGRQIGKHSPPGGIQLAEGGVLAGGVGLRAGRGGGPGRRGGAAGGVRTGLGRGGRGGRVRP